MQTESLGHDDIMLLCFSWLLLLVLQMDPPQRGPTQLIKPGFTEHYYTKEALPC